MTVAELIERLKDLDPNIVLTYVAWDPSIKQFTKWGLSGVTEDGTMVTGDLLDTRVYPEVF